MKAKATRGPGRVAAPSVRGTPPQAPAKGALGGGAGVQKRSKGATSRRGAKKPDKAETARRRKEIHAALAASPEARLPFEELQRQWGVSFTALYKDADYFREKGVPVAVNAKHFVLSHDGLKTIDVREGLRRAEKESIGRLGTRLIVAPLGPHPGRGYAGEDAEKHAHPFLLHEALPGLQPALAAKLRVYAQKAHRLAVCDSGTTTTAIARHLDRCRTPDPQSHLTSLRVLTNGLTVAAALNKSQSRHGIILLGGSLRRDTGAMAGILAERCLEGLNLTADIAFIGATNLGVEGDFYCDSEEEASIKGRLLHAARIRCIAVDSTKIMNPTEGTWCFATTDGPMIDLVLTDGGILETQSADSREEHRKVFLKRMKDKGIFVAVERKVTSEP